MRRAVAMCVLLFILPKSAYAQITARQGVPDAADEVTEFRSPMVLDLPLTIADPKFWGKGEVRSENEAALRKYVCEGVSFVDFGASAVKQRGGSVKTTFHFTLANEPGVDKLAAVKLSIIAAEREVASSALRGIDVEEGRRASRSLTIVVPEAEMRATPPPTLRIVVSVKDNG